MVSQLSLESIRVAYANQTNWVINDLSLRVQAGQCTGIIGHNGKGKSTLAHAIVGIIPYITPGHSEGRAWLDDENLFSHNLPTRLKSVGYSFQDSESQVLFGTVADVVGIKEHQCNEELLRMAINKMRIGHLINRTPDELSGGEMQRVALITALRSSPALIIYDEASSALDPQARQDFKELVEELKRREYILILLGQQNEILSPYCDTLLTLYDGRLVENTSPQQIEPHWAEAFWHNMTQLLPSNTAKAPKLGFQAIRFSRWGNANFTLGPINLSIESGETIAILGPNGSGKTSLLHLLMGTMKPNAGVLSLDGHEYTSATSSSWARVLTMVSQSPLDQIISGSIREELNIPHLANKVSGECKIENELSNHFSFLKMDEDPLQLSHGQQRMLTMLSAFLSDHSILLIDEPEQGFDASHLQYIKSWMHLNSKKRSKTVLFATHDFKFAADIADRCLLIVDGRIVAETSTRDSNKLEQWYFSQINNTQ